MINTADSNIYDDQLTNDFRDILRADKKKKNKQMYRF